MGAGGKRGWSVRPLALGSVKEPGRRKGPSPPLFWRCFIDRGLIRMKVLFLGAGASKSAGYPLAGELMTTIEQDVRQSRDLQLRNAWGLWEQVKERAPGPVRLLLEDPNPEVTLSFVDLCVISHAGSIGAFPTEAIEEALSYAQSGEAIPDRYFISPDHKWLHEASIAKFRLIDCLLAYFDWKHYEDAEQPERRDYLRTELAKLSPGDIVITLNWDSTIERTLFEMGRWSPSDGYGFAAKLHGELPDDPPTDRVLRPSEVIILKLHGSVGWRLAGAEFYLHNDFLQFLLPPEEQVVCDWNAFRFGDGSPAIAYPSFMKTFNAPSLLEVWRQADYAIRAAEQIEIWGYSLPLSDSAVRVLLNPLRSRLVQGQVRVSVHEPWSGEVRDRWRHFLGPDATIDRAALGDQIERTT
jgi:hypothetical protein